MRAPLPGAWFTGPHTRLRIKRHAPPRLPHRVKIRGLQNSGSFLCRSSSRTFSGKSRLACFYNCGLSVTLRLGFLTESKSEDNKIATGSPAAHIRGHDGIGRHARFRCCHLGERFFRGSSPRTFFGKSRLACFYKRGSSVTLRHGFPRRVKTEDNKIAAGIPAAHICGYGGNGRLGGFRFLCREACGFESHYPYQRPTCIL